MQRVAVIVFSFLSFGLTSVLAAESLPANTVADVKIASNAEQAKIEVVFTSDFNETISTDFENGLIQVTLPRTTFHPSLAYQTINDRFIKNIRLIKVSSSSILEIHFADPGFVAAGMIKEKTAGSQFILLINKSARFKPEEPAKSPALKVENADQPDQQVSLLGANAFSGGDMTVNIIKMLVALFLLLLFFYLLLWIYKRFFVSRFRFNKGKYDIKVSSSYHISPKQKIIVLEVNGAAYACGVTANNISVISKVSADTFSDYLSNLKLSGNKDLNFADIRVQYNEHKKKQANLQPGVKESGSKFATELIQRVKNLKPLD
ncbi:flagellar biosynthetic protein FliO [bacterium]|nr:flagellar biosynthetic protein FliO [bacterium]